MKDFKTIKEEAKFKIDNALYRAEVKMKNAVVWATNNPEVAIAALTATGVVVKKTANAVNRDVRYRREKKDARDKEMDFWDPSLRMHVYTRRPLNSDEVMHFAEKRMEGERVVDILSEMHLLK